LLISILSRFVLLGMNPVELAELPVIQPLFQKLYYRDIAGLQAALAALLDGHKTISVGSWRRLVDIAAEQDDAKAVAVLVEHGLPVSHCYGAVSIAARNNFVSVLQVLISAGAPVNGEIPPLPDPFASPQSTFRAVDAWCKMYGTPLVFLYR
jgi:hypothetical protein